MANAERVTSFLQEMRFYGPLRFTHRVHQVHTVLHGDGPIVDRVYSEDWRSRRADVPFGRPTLNLQVSGAFTKQQIP
jgi:hypothetical protein